MSDLREYELNGSTFLLNDEDAKRLDAKPVGQKQAEKPRNKARRVADKAAGGESKED